jgi:hypothetical protein
LSYQPECGYDSHIEASNPISPSLTPPGERRLANFHDLFGIVGQF